MDSYLKNNLGLAKGITTIFDSLEAWQWVRDGGEYEDIPPGYMIPYRRSRNHFHDPLLSLDQAGYTSLGSFCDVGHCPASAVLWALGPQNSDKVLGLELNPGGDWSWSVVRTSYFRALTSIDLSLREMSFRDTLRGLGHVMHLVQDMSVPEHTRNDGHVAYAYEEWVRDSQSSNKAERQEVWTNALTNPILFDMNVLGQVSTFGAERIPITNLFDMNQYNGSNPQITLNKGAGLAEYTNANFFSPDTIFSVSYPNPAKTNTNSQLVEIQAEDGAKDRVYFIYSSEQNYKLAAYSFFANRLPSEIPGSWKYNLNDDVFKDYASRLLPRAVGYSAALLNYFFRGTIEINVPDSGFYSAATATSNGFTQIKVRAKNTTPNDETMPDGTVQLVVKYQPVQDTEFAYQVVTEATGTRAIPRDSPSQLAFNLGTPIPFTATDLTIQLVYHGKLGNEDGAVAVGFKDISEPTPIDIYNAMDEVCIGGSLYLTNSQSAINAVDAIGNKNGVADETDIYDHTAKPVYVKISSARNPQWASPELYDFVVSEISPSTLVRPAYLLVEHEPLGVADFVYSLYDLPEKIDANDTWGHGGMAYLIDGTAYQNQVGYIDSDPTQCDGARTCSKRVISDPYSFRGNPMWWGGGFIYRDVPYPEGSQCSEDLL